MQPYGTPASATHYHYALDGTLLAESEADGDPAIEYIVRPGVGAASLPLALVPDPQGDPDELAYVHADHLGAAQAITDAGQAIDWDLVAGPFGELEDLTASLTHNPRFPGQYADAETGYRYNHFRDYDPAIGRYLQSDPIGLGGGLNTYAYVDGNPVNWVDPWGLKGGYVPDPTLPPEPEDTPDGDGPEMCIPRLFEGPEVPIFPEIQIVERRGPGGGRLPAALIPGYGERGTPAKSLGASVSDAKSAYPNLAGIMEWHHVWPKYLGGPNRGPVVRINAAYHQVITNAFRKAWPYGNRIPTTQELRRLIRQIYSNFPIPN
jgi:RHS repeat-associated protein